MSAPDRVKELVDTFDRSSRAYRSTDYKETQLRREFIDPFFIELGWDVNNEKGYAPQYRDVIHEDALKVGEFTKAPDYAFCVGGVRKFFVEVKKPSVDIKDDISPAFQVRRYAWSAKLPLSILTDFEELAVYDCRIKPAKTDKASTARILFYTHRDYETRWDEIASVFGRDAVLKGSFDGYVESTKAKKGTTEVDAAFLKEIESWRDLLARNIAIRNPNLSQRDLNYAIQASIDRIIFLRVCEDRGIEKYGRLMALLNGTEVYRRLMQIFYQADDRYNSGLFHFSTEKDRPGAPDDLTPGLIIDDGTLKEIIKNLYYPESPYVFSEIPADILGQVYEQFLGKVIRLTAGHRAVVEDKPEVKKAGGVYYTPTYIVDYIVENTVGKLLEAKTPRQAAKLTILDPACGSGSFLIGAYRRLLEWHRKWYEDNGPEKHKDVLYQGTGGGWFLTTAEKKRILLNNIYGVDIDPQAVEVTKLSLLLRVLEGESEETITKQLRMFKERALPDLSDNIKCGNSLIGPDFYQNQQMSLLDDEERYRINVFDWEKEFAEIMRGGGFDAVIGNPPWVFTRDVDFGDNARRYYHDKYSADLTSVQEGKAKQSGKINLYAIFLLRGIRLLDDKGMFGFILPNSVLRATIYDIIRRYILDNCCVKQIVDLKSGVFQNVTASTVILLLEKNKDNSKNDIQIIDNQSSDKIDVSQISSVRQASFLLNVSYLFNIFMSSHDETLFKKMKNKSINLGNLVYVYNGIATNKNKEGMYDSPMSTKCKPLLLGKDISRYHFTFSNRYIEYDRKMLLRPREESIFLAKEKLVMQRIGGILITAYDDQKYYTFNSVNNLLVKEGCPYDLKFILGILNSKLMRFYYISNFTNRSNLTVNISKTYLDKLPFPSIDLNKPLDKDKHDKMTELVDNMLVFNKKNFETKTPQDKISIQRQINTLERQIDSLVYELFALTEEEIEIVEGASTKK
jgi:type I restriction-modification system DNA methylase subunit